LRLLQAASQFLHQLRRRHQWGFCSVELLQVGDFLIRHDLTEEYVASVQRVDSPARTISIYVPGTNVYAADGVWVHNTSSGATGSGSASGSGSSGSGSGSKSSGSSFSSSASSSGSSSSASSSASSSGSLSGSLSGSSGGSTSGSSSSHSSIAGGY
jgi:hypothetical protein